MTPAGVRVSWRRYPLAFRKRVGRVWLIHITSAPSPKWEYMLDTCVFNWCGKVRGIRLGGGPHTARYFFDRAADLIVASEHVHIELHVGIGVSTSSPTLS